MNNQYIKFGYKLLILLAIMFVVDRVGGATMAYFFEKEPLGDAAAFSHAIENPKEDILFTAVPARCIRTTPACFRKLPDFSCLTVAAMLLPSFIILQSSHLH